MTQFALLRHWYPGVDPAQLTWGQLLGYLDRIAELREAESGQVDHRERVQRMQRRKREQ